MLKYIYILNLYINFQYSHPALIRFDIIVRCCLRIWSFTCEFRKDQITKLKYNDFMCKEFVTLTSFFNISCL